MAKIRRLPPVDPPSGPPPEPESDGERADRLEAENRILRAYLNDLDKLVQRVLALRAGRGRLLWLAIATAILLYAGIPGTLLNRALVDAWNALHPPRAHAHYVQPPIYDAVVPFPSPISSPTAVPSIPMTLPSASAVPPTLILKPDPSPTPSPSIPTHPCSVTHGQPPQCRPSPM